MNTDDRVQRLYVRCTSIEAFETVLSTVMAGLALWAWLAFFGLWTGIGVIVAYTAIRSYCAYRARAAIAMIRTLSSE